MLLVSDDVPRRDSFLPEKLEIETNRKAVSPDNIEEVYSSYRRGVCVCVCVCVCVRASARETERYIVATVAVHQAKSHSLYTDATVPPPHHLDLLFY